MVVRVWFVMLLLIVLSLVSDSAGDGSWSFVFGNVDQSQDIQQDNGERMYIFLQKENETFSGLKNQLQEMEERIQNKLDAMLNKLVAMESNTTGTIPESKNPEYISSCLEEPTKKSGDYFIQLGPDMQPIHVICEQDDFGGGWIVFQHRYTGEENFFRNWSDFRDGFGDLNGEYWLGLEHIHQLTASRPHELMIEVKDFKGNYGYAHYDEFEIGNESEGYDLRNLGEYDGTVGDAMVSNRGEQFSTFDRPNDAGTCAEEKKGGWWYQYCSYANLNGPYMNVTNDWSSMNWYTFKKDYRGLSYSRMMIRELNRAVEFL